jgi:hypothetical protein
VAVPAGVYVVAGFETGFHFAEIHRVLDDLTTAIQNQRRALSYINAD